MADSGAIALPNFQRSYVWPNQRIADYIAALFEDRPDWDIPNAKGPRHVELCFPNA